MDEILFNAWERGGPTHPPATNIATGLIRSCQKPPKSGSRAPPRTKVRGGPTGKPGLKPSTTRRSPPVSRVLAHSRRLKMRPVLSSRCVPTLRNQPQQPLRRKRPKLKASNCSKLKRPRMRAFFLGRRKAAARNNCVGYFLFCSASLITASVFASRSEKFMPRCCSIL